MDLSDGAKMGLFKWANVPNLKDDPSVRKDASFTSRTRHAMGCTNRTAPLALRLAR